ncbi:hypothetical protein TNCV_366901 [Trichonephila clavipes]|nr:hypothetical protein TNCV_366901 [Trichonephila clavipes]
MLGRRIAARPRPPATVRNLEIALLEEWNSIPQSGPLEILRHSRAQNGDSCLSQSKIDNWIERVKQERTYLGDDATLGSPSTSTPEGRHR